MALAPKGALAGRPFVADSEWCDDPFSRFMAHALVRQAQKKEISPALRKLG